MNTVADPNYIAKPILVEALEENLADDPYGTACYVIRNTIHRALRQYGGTMNNTEHAVLITLEESLRKLDNA